MPHLVFLWVVPGVVHDVSALGPFRRDALPPSRASNGTSRGQCVTRGRVSVVDGVGCLVEYRHSLGRSAILPLPFFVMSRLVAGEITLIVLWRRDRETLNVILKPDVNVLLGFVREDITPQLI